MSSAAVGEAAGGATARQVLDFWFGGPDGREFGQRRKAWFAKDAAFDAEIRARFLDTHLTAAAGRLDDWRQSPPGALALIVLLDQFPRNMFRDTAHAFATDAKALALAQHVVAQGWDRALAPLERMFVYLPFEHSEHIDMQRRSLALMSALPRDSVADVLDYAQRHLDVIARFGRFPHRNRILERESTPDEIEFLRQPGSSF